MTVHDFVDVNPNETISNRELRAEAELVLPLADVGKSGRVRYVIQLETLFESWGIRNMDSATGKFYGAPYDTVEAPIQYGRVLSSAFAKPKRMQFEFLTGIQSSRFKELQKITGAYQGEGNVNRNQLLDAFHLWCAEHNECNYFLTLDFKLIRVLRQKRKSPLQVKVVRPSELLEAVSDGT
jgi:hypothetical protein